MDRAFQPLRGRRVPDRLFYVASEAADYSRAWHALSLVLLVVRPAHRRHALRLAVFLGVESVLVNGVLKRLTRRARPPLLDGRTYTVRRPKTSSFPSGHASSATLAAALFSESVPGLRPMWYSLAATVSASRIHNRMHHASDVVAGTVLGALFALAARRWWPVR